MDPRIKGQEVEILLIAGNVALETITDVRSAEVEAQLEILREGYLGETTDRRDDVYRGVRGRIELHIENQAILNLLRQVIDRSRRRVSGIRINVKMRLNFPNGEAPLIVLPDVKFGAIPIGFPSRVDYGTVSLDFETEDFLVLEL